MIKHLVLAGLGPGHLHLLEYLARQAGTVRADIGISLLTRQHRYISDATLSQTVASGTGKAAERLARDAAAQAEHLELLVQKTGVRWIDNTARGLDAASKTLLLDDGRTLRFDWLSLEPEAEQDRELIEKALPGARANGLFVRPHEAFCKLWPQVQALAATRGLRFTVVMNNTAATDLPALGHVHMPATEKPALELAFAVRQAFKNSAVTLVTGGGIVGAGLNPPVQIALAHALQKRRIHVLRDAASAITPGEIQLRGGARLASDVPLLVGNQVPPEWLLHSGLAQNAQGQLQTDRNHRSTSHPMIFIGSPECGATAKGLFKSLRRVVLGQPSPPETSAVDQSAAQQGLDRGIYQGVYRSLYRLDCADGYALLAWRNWAVETRQLWARRS